MVREGLRLSVVKLIFLGTSSDALTLGSARLGSLLMWNVFYRFSVDFTFSSIFLLLFFRFSVWFAAVGVSVWPGLVCLVGCGVRGRLFRTGYAGFCL